MAAGRKIHITITGVQYPMESGNDEAVTTVQEVEAEYFHKDDSHYLFYVEQLEGFPAPLRTRIKLKKQTLEIHRQGPGGSTMFFAPGQTYRTEYPTPYGALLLDIVTTSLMDTPVVSPDNVQEDIWPNVMIEYTLQNEGEDIARYKLTIGNE